MILSAQVKAPKILVIPGTLQESILVYAEGIRALLIMHRVPRSEWQRIWNEPEKFKDADEDLDLQWFIGWFRGTADALGASEKDLVTL